MDDLDTRVHKLIQRAKLFGNETMNICDGKGLTVDLHMFGLDIIVDDVIKNENLRMEWNNVETSIHCTGFENTQLPLGESRIYLSDDDEESSGLGYFELWSGEKVTHTMSSMLVTIIKENGYYASGEKRPPKVIIKSDMETGKIGGIYGIFSESGTDYELYYKGERLEWTDRGLFLFKDDNKVFLTHREFGRVYIDEYTHGISIPKYSNGANDEKIEALTNILGDYTVIGGRCCWNSELLDAELDRIWR